MRQYRPRRSTARWLEGAPECVLACYDNGGKTADRYTVLLGGSLWKPKMGRVVHSLNMSPQPHLPNGVSIWAVVPAGLREIFGKKVRWFDLPGQVRDHVKLRVEAG